ncbi:hypothetical protein ETP1_004 [Edwardsiella phage ETP-1]|uniref:Uncharacterized protein n=3 Tax=Kafunavirus KF1 TaxID=1982588 RepID=A0A6G5P471_9CAUD|nr:hypothetical protein D877_gp07 [Edwardsiella phage KF-1]QBP07005.1 hypothetical protein ETP1_004 [Edwardsiella phage ETP-1]UIS54064.1 hypothetical protein ZHX_gp4 [Edwardsiella phage vB_EpP_ZHX]BAM63055.1 hypothetical protein [Edwardsiella phage KF-1]BAM63103.1 hypothetical protein [Edwardsiella phage IW-1]
MKLLTALTNLQAMLDRGEHPDYAGICEYIVNEIDTPTIDYAKLLMTKWPGRSDSDEFIVPATALNKDTLCAMRSYIKGHTVPALSWLGTEYAAQRRTLLDWMVEELKNA